LSINNGIVFKDAFITESKEKIHRYFNKNSFELGSLHYNGQIYFNVLLKYDLFKDDIIVKILYENNFSVLRLETEKIKEFNIQDNFFVSASFFEERDVSVEKRFYEKIHLSKKYSLFKTSEKKVSQYKAEYKVYDKFTLVENFYLLYNNKFYLIESKKDFKKIVPSLKTKIYSFFKKNKKILKKDPTTFYKLLIQSIARD
jgi:hypothetical protein